MLTKNNMIEFLKVGRPKSEVGRREKVPVKSEADLLQALN